MSDNEPPPAPDSGSNYVTVTINPDPGFVLAFDGLTATEELGRPFLIELSLSTSKAQGKIESMLGSNATVTMTDEAKKKTYFNGIVTRAAYTGMSGGAYRYHIELRPWIWLLTRTADCKIFQQMAPFDIITKIFQDHGFSATKDKRQNQAGSTPTLDYCVQYRESAFDFVTRLMEQYGIYYYFEHSDGEHTLVFCDDPNSHTALPAALPFYFSQTEQRGVEDHVWEFTSDLQLSPGAYTYADYNFTTPAADMTAKSLKAGEYTHGDYEIYDYPGLYDTASDGQKLSDIRLQAHQARLQVFDGRSNARGVRSGVKLTLSGTADAALAQEYTVIKAHTTLTMAEGASDTRGQLIDSHRVDFTAIPGATHFRLESKTERPKIRGPQTAVVVGESGEEITTDQYGRIKVQFYWDRLGKKDENSSCWIRVAQSWGGAGWGAMVIPRIGMEVVVVFLEGNPDRPLVTGIVYNAAQTVPYPLPDKKVMTTFRSNSSKGGGGYNELRFDDTKGTEEVYFQAQYNYNKVVLNNETQKITQDSTITVDKGNRAITVSTGNQSTTISKGDHSLDVSTGKQTNTIKSDQATTISSGNHSLAVSAGGSKTTTGQAIAMTAGTEMTVDATSGITLTCGSSKIEMTTSSIELTCGLSKISLGLSGVIEIKGLVVNASATTNMELKATADMTISGGMVKIN